MESFIVNCGSSLYHLLSVSAQVAHRRPMMLREHVRDELRVAHDDKPTSQATLSLSSSSPLLSSQEDPLLFEPNPIAPTDLQHMSQKSPLRYWKNYTVVNPNRLLSLGNQVLLGSLLAREARVLLLAARHETRGLVTNAEAGDEVLVSVDILSRQVVQKTATLVDESDKSSAGRVVLRVGLEVLGEVGDTLGHASNLVLRASGIGLVESVLFPGLLQSLVEYRPCRRFAIVLNSGVLLVVRLQVSNIDNVILSRGLIISIVKRYVVQRATNFYRSGLESLALLNHLCDRKRAKVRNRIQDDRPGRQRTRAAVMERWRCEGKRSLAFLRIVQQTHSASPLNEASVQSASNRRQARSQTRVEDRSST